MKNESINITTKRLNEAIESYFNENTKSNYADIAYQCGISKASLSQYVNGKVLPKQDRIYLLARVLNVSPSWLMGITDEKENISNNVASWLAKLLKEKDNNTLNLINKISKLSKNELLMLEAIVDSYLNKKD